MRTARSRARRPSPALIDRRRDAARSSTATWSIEPIRGSRGSSEARSRTEARVPWPSAECSPRPLSQPCANRFPGCETASVSPLNRLGLLLLPTAGTRRCGPCAGAAGRPTGCPATRATSVDGRRGSADLSPGRRRRSRSSRRRPVPLESMGSILDFGCGCGRVIRWWRTSLPRSTDPTSTRRSLVPREPSLRRIRGERAEPPPVRRRLLRPRLCAVGPHPSACRDAAPLARRACARRTRVGAGEHSRRAVPRPATRRSCGASTEARSSSGGRGRGNEPLHGIPSAERIRKAGRASLRGAADTSGGRRQPASGSRAAGSGERVAGLSASAPGATLSHHPLSILVRDSRASVTEEPKCAEVKDRAARASAVRRHFGRTLTTSSRNTGWPSSASISGRARVPISRTIAPPLPTRICFCESVST